MWDKMAAQMAGMTAPTVANTPGNLVMAPQFQQQSQAGFDPASSYVMAPEHRSDPAYEEEQKILQAVFGEQAMKNLKAPKLSQEEIKQRIIQDEVGTSMGAPDRMPAMSPVPAKFAGKFQKEADKSYADMIKSYMKKREELAKNAEDRAKILGTNFKEQVNLSPLMNFVDNMHGTNISAGYQAPETWAQRNQQIQAYEDNASQTHGQLTDDAMNMLRHELLEKQRDDTNAYRMASLQNKQGGMGEAQKAVERSFGKLYAEDFIGGKIHDREKIVNQLGDVLTELRAPGNQSGSKLFAKAPKFAQDMFWEEETDRKERVEDVIQRNLREVLGAQFTEKEGERLISRAYNPALSDEVNAARLERVFNASRDALQARKAAGEYFRQHGTILGYEGPREEDIIGDLKREFNVSSDVGDVNLSKGHKEDGYELIDPSNPGDPNSWRKL